MTFILFPGYCYDRHILVGAGDSVLREYFWLGTFLWKAGPEPRGVHGAVPQGSRLQHDAHHRLLLVPAGSSVCPLQFHI